MDQGGFGNVRHVVRAYVAMPYVSRYNSADVVGRTFCLAMRSSAPRFAGQPLWNGRAHLHFAHDD